MVPNADHPAGKWGKVICWDRIDNVRLATLWGLRDAHILDEFYLSGGTALALHLGHRVSVDLDFFSCSPRQTVSIGTIFQRCKDAFGAASIRVGFRQSDQLWLHINGVQTTFLAWPFGLKYPVAKVDGILIADPRDILAQKAYAIGRRVAARDYVDISYGLQAGVSSLDGLLRDAEEVFVLEGAPLFDRHLFLQQIVYTDDLIDKESAAKALYEPLSFDKIAEHLREEVGATTRRGITISVKEPPAGKERKLERPSLKTWPHGYLHSSTGLVHLREAPYSSTTLCGRTLSPTATINDARRSRQRFCRVCGDVLRSLNNLNSHHGGL